MYKKIAFAAAGLLLIASPLIASAQEVALPTIPQNASLQQLEALVVQLTQILNNLLSQQHSNDVGTVLPGLSLTSTSITPSTFSFTFDPGQWTSYGYQIDYGDGQQMMLCSETQGCLSWGGSAEESTHGYTTPGTYTVTLYVIQSGQKKIARTVTITAAEDPQSTDKNEIQITTPASGSTYPQDQYIPVSVSGSASRQAYGYINALHKVNGSWVTLPTSWSINPEANSHFGPGTFSINVPYVIFSSNTSLTNPTPPGDWGLQAVMYTYGCGGDDCSPPTNRTLAQSEIVPLTITAATVSASSSPDTGTSISLSAPEASSHYKLGQPIDIQWNVTGAPANTQVILDLTGIKTTGGVGGGEWGSAVLNVGSNTGSYQWKTGSGGYLSATGQYELTAKVMDCDPRGCSYTATFPGNSFSPQTYAVSAPVDITIDPGTATSCPANYTLFNGICQYTPPTNLPTPVINSFTATPSSVQSGQSSTLSWNVSNVADGGCYISTNGSSQTITPNNDWGGTGTFAVNSAVTTTYTLWCTSSWKDGSPTATKQLTVSVGSSPTPTASITAAYGNTQSSNGALTVPIGTTASIQWTSSGEGSCSVASNPGGAGGQTGQSGNFTFTMPQVTTVFTLTCFDTERHSSIHTVTLRPTAATTPTPTPTVSDAQIKTDLADIANALVEYWGQYHTYNVANSGYAGEGMGYVAYQGGGGYTTAVTTVLYNDGFLKRQILENAPANYMLYTCNNGQQYALSATLASPTSADIAALQASCNGTGANGTYTSYHKNYVITGQSPTACEIQDIYTESAGATADNLYFKVLDLPPNAAPYSLTGAGTWDSLGLVVDSTSGDTTILKGNQTIDSAGISYILARKNAIQIQSIGGLCSPVGTSAMSSDEASQLANVLTSMKSILIGLQGIIGGM